MTTEMLVVIVTFILVLAIVAYHWQKTLAKLHETEKEIARSGSSQELEDRFRLLSQETLDRQEEKSTKAVKDIVTPMREEVEKFGGKIEEYIKESRSTKDILDEKFKNMDSSVASLSKDAKDLADALRGDPKSRGDWGETVLRRLLEIAGLRENESFSLQKSYEVEGSRIRPDAVILLPGDREVVIDSKVSLIAYQDYAGAKDDDERKKSLKDLKSAVDRQIDETSKYNSIAELNKPGFSFMFMPIEPAWLLVASEFPDLLESAQRKGVVLAGPTNMLATLKVVEHIWLAERKEANQREIFNQAEKLLDSAVRVTDLLETLEKRADSLRNAIDSLNTAMQGRRGVFAHARKLSEYGVKGKKELPEQWEGISEMVVEEVETDDVGK